jgi:hypothetical protein
MTTFQGLTATQWRNRINDYNPGMYTKEFLKKKTAKELAQIQNGKSYGTGSKIEGKPSLIVAKGKNVAKGKCLSLPASLPAIAEEWDPESDDEEESADE